MSRGDREPVCKRPLTTSEATDWIKSLLAMQGFRDLEGLGAHSMKSTLLSWCAKRGLPLDIRRALGYHMAADDHSVLTYSRDSLARPLRKLEAVLSEVRLGIFDPDASRSGHLKPREGASQKDMSDRVVTNETFEAEQEWYHAQNSNPVDVDEVAQEVESDSSSSSSSSENESGQEELAVKRLVKNPRRKRLVKIPEGCVMYQHKRYSTLHLVKVTNPSKFNCGRLLHGGYSRVKEDLFFDWPRCVQCFGSES